MPANVTTRPMTVAPVLDADALLGVERMPSTPAAKPAPHHPNHISLLTALQKNLFKYNKLQAGIDGSATKTTPRASVAVVLRLSDTAAEFTSAHDESAGSVNDKTGDDTNDINNSGSVQEPQLGRLANASTSAQLMALLIKRAHRDGDRWSGQVRPNLCVSCEYFLLESTHSSRLFKIAYPGGRRERGDASDQATAERETMEEIGLDLAAERQRGNVVLLGRLPERVVTRWFDTEPQLVLSAFGRENLAQTMVVRNCFII